MDHVDLKLPEAPRKDDVSDIHAALGRVVVAWSASEFCLALLMSRLMGSLDINNPETLRKAAAGEAVALTVDTNAVFSIFLAIESSRGRRELVGKLADIRKGENHISEEWQKKIRDLLAKHAKIASERNKYMHTPMGMSDDGFYILMDEKILLHRKDRTKISANPQNRANDNRVTVHALNGLLEKIAKWNEEARQIGITLVSKPVLGRE